MLIQLAPVIDHRHFPAPYYRDLHSIDRPCLFRPPWRQTAQTVCALDLWDFQSQALLGSLSAYGAKFLPPAPVYCSEAAMSYHQALGPHARISSGMATCLPDGRQQQ